MIKPRVGITTVVMKGFNQDEEDAIGYQKQLVKAVEKMGFEPVVAPEFIDEYTIAAKNADFFNSKDIDLYILLFGTFSDDARVMPLITGVDKPMIVWATDYNPFNISITGSQNVMPNIWDLGIDFRFIYGDFNDKFALHDLYVFSRACAIKNKLSKTRIGYVGGHANIMTCQTIDEILVKKIFGTTIVNFGNEYIILGREKVSKEETKNLWDEIKSMVGSVKSSDKNGLMTSSTLVQVLKMIKDNKLQAISINCFPHLKGQVCIPVARLNDLGIPSACEGDLNSTILMYIMYLLTGKASSNGDQLKVYNLDKPGNSIMFSHCGAGALSLTKNKKDIVIHDDYETGKGVAIYFPENIPGEVTMGGLIGSSGEYRMFIANGKAVGSNLIKAYEGNPLEVEFPFNVRDMFKQIAYNSFNHHWNIAYGNLKEELLELCQLLKINSVIME